MVAEAVVDQLAGTKTRRINGPRHAPVILARAFWFINGPGAGKHMGHVGAVTQCAEAAKGIAAGLPRGLLALKQLVLAGDGQACQRGPGRDGGGVNAVEDFGKSGCLLLCVGDLQRQCRHQGGFAIGARARFK